MPAVANSPMYELFLFSKGTILLASFIQFANFAAITFELSYVLKPLSFISKNTIIRN